MGHGANHGIKCGVEVLREVLDQEAQDMAAVFLEHGILAAVAAVAGWIGKVLRAVDLDDEEITGFIRRAVMIDGSGCVVMGLFARVKIGRARTSQRTGRFGEILVRLASRVPVAIISMQTIEGE